MVKAGRIFIILLIPIIVAISYCAFCDRDSNLEIAKKIYREFSGGEKYAPSIYEKSIVDLPRRLANSIRTNPQSADIEIFRTYCAMSSINAVIYDAQILEILDILIEQNNPKYFAEFLKLANYSDDIVLKIFYAMRNPVFREYFSINNCKSIFKNYPQYASAFYFGGINITTDNTEKIEKTFYYIGTNNFNISWKLKKSVWGKYGFPAIAYIAKLQNKAKLYDYFKKESISQRQLSLMSAGIFEYVEYAAKIFAMCGDPKIATCLIDHLPDGKEKTRIIKAVIRNILESEGGLDAVRQSNFGKNLQ